MKGYEISRFSIISILLILLSCSGLVYADRFVSVNAAADGDGTFEKPWKFSDALQQVLPDGEAIFVNGSSSTAYIGPMNIRNRSIFIGYNGTPRVSADGPVFIVSNATTLNNFLIDNYQGASIGVQLSHKVQGVNLSSVTIQRMTSSGIYTTGSQGNYYSDLTIRNSLIKNNQGTGIFLNHLSPLKIDNVSCSLNQNGGLLFKNISDFTFNSLVSEGNVGARAGCTLNDSYVGTLDKVIISGNAEGGFSLYNSSFITINSSIFRDHSTGFDFYGDNSSHGIHLNDIRIGGDTGANITALNISKGFGFTTPTSIPLSPLYNSSLGVYVDIITGPDSSFDQLSLHYNEVPTGYPEENICIMKYSEASWSDVPSHVDTAKNYVSFNDSGSLGVGSFTFGVFTRQSPPSIHFISPNVTYLNQSIIYVDVFGSSFNESALVEISNGTFSQTNASPIQFVNDSLLNASFQAEDFISGFYWLKVTNPDLQESNLIPVTFTVPCPSVSANFSGNISSGVAPLTVLFSDSSSGGTISAWNWTFGDGGLSTGHSPEHTFTIPGTYQVNLTAGNDCDNSASTFRTIEVQGAQCPSVSANFSGNTSCGVSPLTVLFTDSSTGGNITTRSWAFGDGSANQTGSGVVHTFTQAGNYSVTLFALNECGNTGMRTETIQVVAPSPVCPAVTASFRANLSSGTAPLTVLFTDSSTGGNITGRSWTFGDGSVNQTGSSVVHTFTQASNYTVTLFALNDCGNAGMRTETIQVVAPSPVCPAVTASFRANLSSGTAPLTVLFTDSSTGGNLTTRSWNFGDGSVNQTGSSVVHTFTQAGNYSVTLFALNDCGNAGMRTETIQVVAPSPVCPAVSAFFTANLSSGTAPLTVLFTDSSTGGNITGRSWTFGDGSVNQTGSSVVHTFTQASNYTVTLFALNDCGNTGMRTETIQVVTPSPVCPVVSASFRANLSSGTAPLTVLFTDSSTGGNLTTRSWTFGDGSVNQTGSSVVHTFTQASNYTVTLFALNECGNTGMRTETIQVVAPSPVCPAVTASFLSNLSSGTAPLSVLFTDSSTGGNITGRSWNFGDGSMNQTGSSVVHTFTQAGNYSVTLFALNDCGKFGAFSNFVHVSPPQPVPGTYIINATSGLGGKINPTGLVPVIEGSNQSFIIDPVAGFTIGSVIVDGVQMGELPSYTFGNIREGHTIHTMFNPVSAPPDKVTIIADADIGSAIDPSGPVYVREGGSQSFRIWAKAGSTVQDVLVNGISIGNPTSYKFSDVRASQTISVRSSLIPGALQPDFVANITAGPAPLHVRFSDATIGAPSQYFWRFGDGSFSTEKNPTHLYTNQGLYAVSLTVKNAYGSSIATKKSYISVTDQQYTISSQAGVGGSIMPNGSFSVYAGSDQTFTITPSPGYRIEDLVLNGQSIGQVPSYTLSRISSDHRLQAQFISLTPAPVITDITPGTGDQGTVLPLLTITGRYFTGGERVDLVREGSVNITGMGNLSAGSLLVYNLDLRTATPGTYDVWVIGNGTGASVLKEAFTVTSPPVPVPAPQITGISPSVAYQNSILPQIEITGSNFSQSCQIDLTMPGAPFLSGTGRLSGGNSLILDNLDLRGAPVGVRNLTVTDIGTKMSATLPGALNILVQPQIPAPVISGISPHEADHDTIVPGLMIQGTGMYGGEDVRLVKGSHSMNVTGVAIPGGIVVQNLSLTDASPGLYSIHVTNLTTGLSGSLIHGFKVSGSELYTILAGSNQFALVNPTGNHTAPAGGSKSFVVKPSAGCRLVNVTVDGALVETDATGRYTFTNVDRDHTLYATGEPLNGVIIVGFTANITSGSSPLMVQFRDTSSGSPKQWFWTFGDGSSSQIQNPVHTYTRAGTYTVKLWVRNDRSSGTRTQKQMITVIDGNAAPSAASQADVSSGTGLPAVVSMPEGSPLSSVSSPVHSGFVPSSPLVPSVVLR